MIEMGMKPAETGQVHKALSKMATRYGCAVSPFRDLSDLLRQFEVFRAPGRESGVRLVLLLNDDTPLTLAPPTPEQLHVSQTQKQQQQRDEQGRAGAAAEGSGHVATVAQVAAIPMRSYVPWRSGTVPPGQAAGVGLAAAAAAAGGSASVVCGGNIVHAGTGDRLVDSLSSWYLPYHGHQLFEVLPSGLVPRAPRVKVQGIRVDWKMNPWRKERSSGAKVSGTEYWG
jgi:hypothetical protein